MKSLKGTRTEKNLLISFAGESQARNRYTYFAGQAKKDGFVQIQDVFLETADQEKEHAKRFFKFLEGGGDLEITYAFPPGIIKDTESNLLHAAAGEKHEHEEMYPAFAKIAREEGFNEVAVVWEKIMVAEEFHERRFRDFARNVNEGRVFFREQPVTWRCLNCGYLHEGPNAPELCPACIHPKSFFELLKINW